MKDIYFSDNNNVTEDIYSDSDNIPQFPNEEPGKNKKKKRKKRFRPFRILIKTVIILLVLLTMFIFTFAAISKYERNDLKYNKYVSALELKQSPFVTNILLLGCDSSEASSASRSDSMILVSIDFPHMKIKLTSFLRDCYVYIPSMGKKAKLNAAFANNGAQGVIDTLEYNFKIDIDHYVKVDFEMFTEIIDKLGGLDIEVTQKEAEFINRTTRYTIGHGDSVHLNGAEALVYSRIRKLDSDYERTQRQRKVINALINKGKAAGIQQLLSAMKEIFPLIETDMNPGEITLMSYECGIALLGFETDEARIPTDNLMKTGFVGDQWVETPDLEGCRNYLYNFIYLDKSEDEK